MGRDRALQRALINQNIFVFWGAVSSYPTVQRGCWKGSLPMRRQGWTRAFLRWGVALGIMGRRGRGELGGGRLVRCRYDCYCCCCCCYGWRCLVDFGRQSPSVLPSSPSRLPPVLLVPADRQLGSLAAWQTVQPADRQPTFDSAIAIAIANDDSDETARK